MDFDLEFPHAHFRRNYKSGLRWGMEINEFTESNFHFPISFLPPSSEELHIFVGIIAAASRHVPNKFSWNNFDDCHSFTEEVGGQRRVHLLAPEGAAGVAVLAVLLARRRRLPDDLLHLNWRATCISDHAT